MQFFASLKPGTTSSVLNVRKMNTKESKYVRVNNDGNKYPNVRDAVFDYNTVNNVILVNRIENIGDGLGSEICGTDEQHRLK